MEHVTSSGALLAGGRALGPSGPSGGRRRPRIPALKTGDIFTINTKEKKLYKNDKAVKDISSSFTPQKIEYMRAGGSYAVVFGKKLQNCLNRSVLIEITSNFQHFIFSFQFKYWQHYRYLQ